MQPPQQNNFTPAQLALNAFQADKPIFNGRRMREHKERKVIDYLSNVITDVQTRRLYQANVYKREPYVPPFKTFERVLLPAPSYVGYNESSAICTKLTHISKNTSPHPINVLSFTPSGHRLITGSSEGEFTLWDGKGFNFLMLQSSHNDPVRAMQWDKFGNYMVSADQSGVIKYWEATMNNVKEYQAHDKSIRDCSFSPSNVKFVSASDDATLKVWDFKRCECDFVLTEHGSDVTCGEWHPTSSIIASGSKDHSVRLWDANSQRCVAILDSHKNVVNRVKWNRNGNWLLTCSKDQLIKLHDIRFMKEVAMFRGHEKSVESIEWHPFHERVFASGSFDGFLAYWIVGTSEQEGPEEIINAHRNRIWDIDWHPLGHVLCTGAMDGSTKFFVRGRFQDKGNDRD